MLACPACARSVAVAGALWCPQCGASLSDAETRTTPHASGRRSPPLDDARFAPGDMFASRYRIVAPLGRGGCGDVYRADDTRLGQAVALKLLAPRGTAGSLGRFSEEVRLARGIAHPNVCRVYDIGEADGWHFLSMEFVDGETLESLIRRIGSLPAAKARDVAHQLVAGVAAAHDRGVLHRDLKPSNIMLDGRGLVRILDFGLAVSTTDSANGEIAGTPAYMAPEQIVGGRVTERTDVFSVGAVLYEVVTGRRLIAAQTIAERLHAGDRRAPPSFGSDVDPELAALITACIEPDPAKRPASARSVAARLPGADPVTAAVVEGRVPAPGLVAAVSRTGVLPLPVAWSLLLAVLAGAAGVASQGDRLTLPPQALPKAPQVLVERARAVLSTVGVAAEPADSAAWFTLREGDHDGGAVRFIYRQASRPLAPANLYRIVTETDPPGDAPGTARVTLDGSGRLVGLVRLPESDDDVPAGDLPAASGVLFQEAGLDEHDFEQVESGRRPLIPHDAVVHWTRRAASGRLDRVVLATLAGSPVYFAVGDDDVSRRDSGAGPGGRSVAAGAALWLLVLSAFVGTAVMARRNLLAQEGDRRAAGRLAVVVFAAGLVQMLLRAHHVSLPADEAGSILALAGWVLLWTAFSWLSYVSFEPYVRRFWPGTLVSWTRLLDGRAGDPLVGRDLLLGALGGVVLAGLLIAQTYLTAERSPREMVVTALQGLGAARQTIAIGIWSALNALQYALGSLFFLLLLRLAVGRTWLAAGMLTLLSIPLILGGTSGLPGFLGAAAITTVGLTILLRVGLLAYAATLISEGVLMHTALTLDPSVWYIGASALALLVVAMTAIYGFVVSLGGNPIFGVKASSG